MHSARPKPELFHRTVGDRDIVCRRSYCECGTVLYVKNLTDNTIDFLAKEQWKGPRNLGERHHVVEPGGNPSVVTITCPDCGKRHIVANIKEGTSMDDTVATSTDAITIEDRGS